LTVLRCRSERHADGKTFQVAENCTLIRNYKGC
jgi:hypothetical protein